MASFSDLYTISKDTNFQTRVTYALFVAAVNVYSEESNIPGHFARFNFAKQVFAGNFNAPTISLMVLTNPTIASEAVLATTPGFAIPDSDIQFAVNSLWNDFAGA